MNRFDDFRGRRVLVTGHTGFKGAWLSVWLHALGAKVVGFALDPSTRPNMFEAAGIAACLEDHRGDIRNPAEVRKVISESAPDVVFHLAAQAIVRESYRDPVATYATNVAGTAAVLDACRATPSVRAIVVVTSDKCYANQDWVWGYRENDRLGGFDPYSSSKACAELVTEAFRRSYFQDGKSGVGIATARAGNVIGGGDWATDRLVPDLARAAASSTSALIRNPGAVRPWQHVLEPLEGYLSLASHLLQDPSRFSTSWNFGPSADAFRTVESVVQALGVRWHGRLKWKADAGDHPHEASRLLLDSTKAAVELEWRPRLSIDDALNLTAEWYDAAKSDPAGLRRLTEAQIRFYSGLASANAANGLSTGHRAAVQ